MASYFASQLKDMFFVLVERVTGYGWGESQDGAGKYPGMNAVLRNATVLVYFY